MATQQCREGETRVHAFRDRTGRYPRDAELRRFGFRIHARPRNGPPVWERNSRYYPESEALGLLPASAGTLTILFS